MKPKFLEPPSKSFLTYLKRQDAILAQATRDADLAHRRWVKAARSLTPCQRRTMAKINRLLARTLATGKRQTWPKRKASL